MPDIQKVVFLCGGRSAEHEVSLQSAQNIVRSLDFDKYSAVVIYIDREGRWYYIEDTTAFVNAADIAKWITSHSFAPIALLGNGADFQLIRLDDHTTINHINVLFPVLHGPYGEDGSVQGLAQLANLPCVGANVLGSAISMDKDIMKRLLKNTKLKNAKSLTRYKKDLPVNPNDIETLFGWPVYVKPANMGSSVGVSKASNDDELADAISHAFKFDTKIIIEQEIRGREVEVAVLGNDSPQASEVGEIIPHTDFYSYDSKYISGDGAELVIPASLSEEQKTSLQSTAIEVFNVMECSGLARVDMFLTENNDIYVNEINTLPGFTNISMYPKLWEASGKSQTQLISDLIYFAIEREIEKESLSILR